MNKSVVVLASLVTAVALAACGKKEEPVVVTPAPVVVVPAPAEPTAPAAFGPATAVAPAADGAAATTTPGVMPETGDAKTQADAAAAKAAADAAATAATPAK